MATFQRYFPDATIRVFYWDNALPEITRRIRHNDVPDILLTGHTYVPFISQHSKEFGGVEPIFWDVRVLYVWGSKPQLPVKTWSETLNYLQTHTAFMSFPTTWTPDSFYNYLSFFNDQLPFWISQTPFSSQNMVYTLKFLVMLRKVYPGLFKKDPVEAFLKKENYAIISGLWMYTILKQQPSEFSVFPVPESQNGNREFKGAYVGIHFNNRAQTQKAMQTLRSHNFQQETWETLNLLPTNIDLQGELSKDPILASLLSICQSNRWASPIEPKVLSDRIEVLNYLLRKETDPEKIKESRVLKFFNNKLYFRLMKWFN